jgi:hypothetical protein
MYFRRSKTRPQHFQLRYLSITIHLENLKKYFQTKMHKPVSTHQDKTTELEFAFVPESIFLIDWYLSSIFSL